LENLNDLLNAQPITFGEGELSVIQRDGQHFLVLPNISVSHVLQTNEASAVQSINTGAQIRWSLGLIFVLHGTDTRHNAVVRI